MGKPRPHIDNVHLPLDYSFFQVKKPSEILKAPPRIDAPLQLSHTKDENGKWLTKSLKLNKNVIDELTDLPKVLSSLFPNENWLTWFDLSCNLLQQVPQELLNLTNLKLLYLHGNRIPNMRELMKLKPLEKLIKFTAHGNPVELEPGYFINVLSILPNLVKLDFTGVSANERDAANVIRKNRTRERKQE